MPCKAKTVTVVHGLKCWPEFFQAIHTGKKTFELRVNDRDFKVGDVLLIREWDPKTKKYTGRKLVRDVTYLLPVNTSFNGGPVQPMVIMSIQVRYKSVRQRQQQANRDQPSSSLESPEDWQGAT